MIEKYSRDPQQVRIEQKALTVPTVEQVYYEVDRRYKVDLLTRLIDIHDLKLGIIFCNTKRMVDDLVDHLNAQGYSADRLHGDMTQMMRDRVMQKFRKSGLEFLVATDVAARGIDVDDVEVVFNYDLPYDGEDYVHRIGRTGRKGRSGRAISFASGREVFQIRNIERYTNVRIQRGQPPTAHEVEEARTGVFVDKLRATLKSGELQAPRSAYRTSARRGLRLHRHRLRPDPPFAGRRGRARQTRAAPGGTPAPRPPGAPAVARHPFGPSPRPAPAPHERRPAPSQAPIRAARPSAPPANPVPNPNLNFNPNPSRSQTHVQTGPARLQSALHQTSTRGDFQTRRPRPHPNQRLKWRFRTGGQTSGARPRSAIRRSTELAEVNPQSAIHRPARLPAQDQARDPALSNPVVDERRRGIRRRPH